MRWRQQFASDHYESQQQCDCLVGQSEANELDSLFESDASILLISFHSPTIGVCPCSRQSIREANEGDKQRRGLRHPSIDLQCVCRCLIW